MKCNSHLICILNMYLFRLISPMRSSFAILNITNMLYFEFNSVFLIIIFTCFISYKEAALEIYWIVFNSKDDYDVNYR